MRKSFACLFLVAVSWVALSGSPAFAAPTTTAAATFNNGVVLTPNQGGKWTTILTTTIKNPTADDDLFIDVSQVDALVTDNSTSSATPGVVSVGAVELQLQVLVDGIPATPGAIDFDDQLTALTSKLQKFISLSCTTTTVQNVVVTTSCVCNSTTVTPAAISCAAPPAALPAGYTTRTCTTQTSPDPDVVTTCSLVPGANQSLATLLESSIGHSYDFFAAGVAGIGDTHIVQVQERLFEATVNGGSAAAIIGPSTLKIMAVNLK